MIYRNQKDGARTLVTELMTQEERNSLAGRLIASLKDKGYSQESIGAFIGRSRGFITRINVCDKKYNASAKDVRLLLQADAEKPALPRNANLSSYVYEDTFPLAMTTQEIEAKILTKSGAKKVEIKHKATFQLAGNGMVQHVRIKVWHESQDIRSKKS